MSSSHHKESWIDRWWILLIIIFGLLFIAMLDSFHPMG